MKETTEDHRPWVEFEEGESLELDKAFFREAFEKARHLKGKQCAYMHRTAEELRACINQIEQMAGALQAEHVTERLQHLAALAARNARLACYRAGSEHTPERTSTGRDISGPVKPGDQHYMHGPGMP